MNNAGQSNVPHGDTLLTVTVQNFRLPPFWYKSLRVWPMQVEAQFRLRHITSQKTKYLHTASSLPADVAEKLDDILTTPDAVNPFDHLKTVILERKSEPERSRLQQLLTSEHLGNRRPSQLLHRMRQLLGDQNQDPNNQLMQELFIQRLPQNMVLVLAVAEDVTLDKIAELPDRVADYSKSPSIGTVTGQPPATPDDSRLTRLEDRIDAQNCQISALAPLS